ncbi:flagellar brake protein [Marinimicrobium alkaliphilum]|uniref:flagellar brake protein n=1 Tax=Marinimicrobium alkaliphilum TaxID=2202654 RepID=UPI000DBA4F15|nr:flagellar brake protein [Marinimicrobium alkaliphilum]
MKFEDLKLDLGYPLQMQVNAPDGRPERLGSRLVGSVAKHALIVAVPRLDGRSVRFRPGQKVIVRTMAANGVSVFTTVVQAQITDPYPLVFVDYPEEVVFKGVRNSTRVGVDLAVKVTNRSQLEDQTFDARIGDISLSGCRLELEQPAGDIGDKVQLQAQVEFCGLQRTLKLDGILRSRVERSTQEKQQQVPAVHGVEFAEPDDEQRLVLCAYVYHELAQDTSA